MALSPTALRQLSRRASRKERLAQGRALRKKVPRSSHGSWSPPRDRADPLAVLREVDRSREKALLPIRYGRMALSPFHFLRGAASVMAADLARTPSTGLQVQLGGDAHIGNFGLFATPERDQVFDMNDFDETLPGPWEWDVKRLATSLVLAARYRYFAPSEARRAARLAVRAYREDLLRYAKMRYLDVWYSHLDLEGVGTMVRRLGRRILDPQVEASRRRTGLHAFPKLVRSVRGGHRIRDDPPLIDHFQEKADEERSRSFFDHYTATLPEDRRRLLDRYHVEDVARKVVGVGSVGTECSVVLLTADRDLQDPLLLQVKEAGASALEPHLGASEFSNHAQRVVVGQHLVQQASDIFLGWSSLGSKDFYVRQLRDMKFSMDLTVVGRKALFGQAELCGAALAHAHARTGGPAEMAGYLGQGDGFDEAIVRFAQAYADQTERDHAGLQRAIAHGEVEARVNL